MREREEREREREKREREKEREKRERERERESTRRPQQAVANEGKWTTRLRALLFCSGHRRKERERGKDEMKNKLMKCETDRQTAAHYRAAGRLLNGDGDGDGDGGGDAGQSNRETAHLAPTATAERRATPKPQPRMLHTALHHHVPIQCAHTQ